MQTVLVLDDEPIVTEFLRRALKDFHLIDATTAEQAIRLFLAHDRKVDLLVADVALPRSSGIQVALLLRSAIPDLPVILTVSIWNDGTSTELARLGSNSVAIIEKPYRAEALSKIVRELIGEPRLEEANTAERSRAAASRAVA